MKGSVYKRCHCTDPVTKKEFGKSCPKLARSDHGAWWFRHDIPPGPNGQRRRPNVGPFATESEADQALADSLSELNPAGPAPDNRDLTFGRYLDRWIANKTDLKPSTRHGYEAHIRIYLKPGLGHLKLTELRDDHFDDLYQAMRQIGRDLKGKRPSFLLARLLEARQDDPARRRPPSAATIARVHATVSSALNNAVRRPSLPIRTNPAQYAERPKPRRRKALLWTAPRVAAWERTGRTPSPVMVWTPAQTGAFLDFATDDRLYALWHLVAHRGPRHGEAVGLRWPDVDLDEATAQFLKNDTGIDGEDDLLLDDEYEETKSDASDRLVTLDQGSVLALRQWHARQQAERDAAGDTWVDSGRVFTHPDGRELNPNGVSQRFDRLVARHTTIRREHTERRWSVEYLAHRHRMPAAAIRAALESGPLPPIRFHDLRHNAASLTYFATRDMKAVSSLLGHSSIKVSIDLYTTLFEEADREAAEAAARLIPRTRPPTADQEPDNTIDTESSALSADQDGATAIDRPALDSDQPDVDDLDFGM